MAVGFFITAVLHRKGFDFFKSRLRMHNPASLPVYSRFAQVDCFPPLGVEHQHHLSYSKSHHLKQETLMFPTSRACGFLCSGGWDLEHRAALTSGLHMVQNKTSQQKSRDRGNRLLEWTSGQLLMLQGNRCRFICPADPVCRAILSANIDLPPSQTSCTLSQVEQGFPRSDRTGVQPIK